MKKIYFFAMSLALATMVGCQNENDVLNLQNEISNIAFTASFESNDSRTALQGINNNVVWVEGDKLSVFAGKTVNKPYILDKGNGTNYGTFTFDQLSAGTETNNSSSANLSANVAYYPYSQDVTVSESNGSFTFNATFPEKQIYSESGTFGNGASPMVAVTASKLDDNLMFKNVGGVFRVQLIDKVNNGTPAKISKIIINAKDGTKLAGKCEITASNTAVPTVTATEGESSIVLNCADITLSANDNEPTNFVFAMLPVNVSQGNLIISIYDNAGKKMVYEYPEVLDLKRSTAKSTNVLEYDGAHNAITTSAQLQAAFNDNQNGGVVDLTDDMELSEVVTVDQNVTLNLNGKTITGATLQSRASASSDALIVVKRGATLTIEDGTGLGRLDVGEQNSSIWAAVKMTEKGESAKASDASQRAKLIVNGGTIKGYYYGISGNGDRHDTDIEINGGSIEAYCSNDNLGIFHPQNGTLTIKGGTIKGYNSAIEMRAGTLNIEGGNFIAEASPLSVEGAGDGTTTWGAAIAVSQHTTNQQLSVNISGGTFNGYYALNEVDKQDAESSNISLSISGGTFNGSIASANYKGFITGGTFSDPTALYYLGASANVAVNMLADYIGAGFKTQNGQTVTLNIAEGKKYTVTAPLVGSAGTQTLGFQFLQGSNVTIEGKGTITSSEAKMLINNYSNLTLKDITLSPSIPNTMNGQAYYVLSNNCGEVNIEEGTIITAPQGNDSQKVYAFDVCKYSTYPNVTVNVKGGTITGDVEYTGTEGDKQKLVISGGTINGNLVVADSYKEAALTGISITGGTFSDPSACYYLGSSANVAVNMLADYIGAGFKTQNGQTVTLNIAEGKKYTVTAPLVGSAGTQTLGFQFLQGSNVTIKGKGTITSSEAKMLINNYSNLTLKDITLSPSIPNTMNGQAYYVLSNNCGEVNIEEGTIITAPQGNDSQKVYAFDVCKYSTYPNVTVNVKGGTITGDVEYTGTEGDKQKLVISGGTINGNLVVADSYKDAALTGISITGGAQTGDEWTSYSKQ